MDRYIFSDLKNWIHKKRRKPLLLRGARQVGKTWLVEKLAQEEFENYLKIDFEENTELVSIFEGDLDPQKICAEQEFSDKKFKNIFLDIGLMNRVMKIDYNEALNHILLETQQTTVLSLICIIPTRLYVSILK